MDTTGASRAGSGTGPLGVLELGTNSLKLHLSLQDPEVFQAYRVEWDLGFEVFSSRRISRETIEATLAQARALLLEHGADPARSPVFGIATGAFRDAENTSALLDRLYEDLGVPVRVLSVVEEAGLLGEGAGSRVQERPAMAFDLGGGSLEMVYFGSNGTWLRGDLPLGAIRMFLLGSLASREWDEVPARKWIDKVLQEAQVFRASTVHGTGGTVKAIAQVADSSTIRMEDLRRMEDEARRSGASRDLSSRRRELFLPGVMVVRRLLEHVGARTLQYTRVDLGEVLLSRLRTFRVVLRGPIGRAFLLHQLDIFRPEPERLAGGPAVAGE